MELHKICVFSYEYKYSPENNRKLTLAFQFTV